MAAVYWGSSSGSRAQMKHNLSKENVGRKNKKGFRVSCVSSAGLSDPYTTLRIHPSASESEVKKAFRKLALQYHPDVCKGNNGGLQFQLINEAYDTVMNKLRGESREMNRAVDEAIYDDDSELWEEWMGWEGAGIRDYSSHINPYI